MCIATAVLAAAITVAGCKYRHSQPVPGPKVAPPAPSADLPQETGPRGPAHRGASGISWFQGTLEEAFSTTCPRCTAVVFHH
ncbi:MAG TPA: hypothetical protein VHB68_03845 [Steroidobacteraceae bacterium]|nr:hypothetical protein [Steroidobacteraceae bacterium]